MSGNEGLGRDRHRNRIIEEAVEAVNRIILDGSDGSKEETNHLTAEIARRMIEQALLPFQAELLGKDIEGSEK